MTYAIVLVVLAGLAWLAHSSGFHERRNRELELAQRQQVARELELARFAPAKKPTSNSWFDRLTPIGEYCGFWWRLLAFALLPITMVVGWFVFMGWMIVATFTGKDMM